MQANLRIEHFEEFLSLRHVQRGLGIGLLAQRKLANVLEVLQHARLVIIMAQDAIKYGEFSSRLTSLHCSSRNLCEAYCRQSGQPTQHAAVLHALLAYGMVCLVAL